MTKLQMPVRIVTSGGEVRYPENLLIPKVQQAGFGAVAREMTVLTEGSFVVLDFGRELRGGIALTAGYPEGDEIVVHSEDRLRVVFGESVMEALSSIGYKNATNEHAIRDTVLDMPHMGNLFYGNTGFRFVKLEAVHGDITLKAVRATLDMRDIEPIGSFTCSDERLNRIYEVGAYTVFLNMGEYVWDGVKRDRLVWLGDMHPECATIYAVYGADESIRRSLDLVKAETPSDTWINTLPSYSFWWVVLQCEQYLRTGDLAYLAEQVDYMEAVLRRGLAIAREDPSPAHFDFFVDWSSNADRDAARVGFYAVVYKAFAAAKESFSALRRADLVALCDEGMAAVRAVPLTVPNQKQMAGLAAYVGLIDPRVANETVLARDPYAGLSTFMGYYVLQARALAGDMKGALDVMRTYWGAMLDLGATTFWEDFDIDWVKGAARIDEVTPDGMTDVHGDYGKFCYTQFRHSLCHGWAGGPTAFLAEYVLGIRVSAPGCRRLTIRPDLGDLTFARGTYPTPLGTVTVAHTRESDGRITTTVDAPEGIEVVVEGA